VKLADLQREFYFVLGQKSFVSLFAIAFVLSCFAVSTGMAEIEKQNQTIERLLHHDKLDRQQAIENHQGFGSIAYYSFHLTYRPPSDLAFASIGQRDVLSWKHRIRMLALEGQIHESDTDNPELAFVGRFDFAFLMSVLAPLLVILLLHDLRATERAAGRYDLLISTAPNKSSLWAARAIISITCLTLALILPFVTAALISGTALNNILLVVLISILFLLFWAGLSYYFSNSTNSGPKVASMLMGVWLVTAVILPNIAERVIDASIESPSGGDIVLTQREAVNDAWDLPFETTFDAFIEHYPEWQDNLEMRSLFEWKWYYAFQQVGDQTAEPLSLAYRQALVEKGNSAGKVAWLSPSLLFQRAISRLAETDLKSTIEYQQQVRDFHAELRHFYYPYLFGATAYEVKLIEQRPEFAPKR